MSETDHLATGDRVAIRPLDRADRDEYLALVRESGELHHPWIEPPATPEEFAAYVARFDGTDREGFLVCERTTGRVVGGVNINNIVHGAFRCGALGYAAFGPSAGRGYLTEGLALVIRHAFGPLGLHRLEANIQPGNEASRRLVQRLGFRLEGLSPDFLFVDGAWRDHERWAFTAEMADTLP